MITSRLKIHNNIEAESRTIQYYNFSIPTLEVFVDPFLMRAKLDLTKYSEFSNSRILKSLETIINTWITSFTDITNINDAMPLFSYYSYLLATIRHETGGGNLNSWYTPVRETYYVRGGFGSSTSLNYLSSKVGVYKGKTTKVNGVTIPLYYGRGYCQLTHDYNYKKATERLKVFDPVKFKDLDLLKDPDKVLEPEIASLILTLGSLEGWFRKGKTLKKYLTGKSPDFFNAREIINADKNTVETGKSVSNGEKIAKYATDFYNSLYIRINNIYYKAKDIDNSFRFEQVEAAQSL